MVESLSTMSRSSSSDPRRSLLTLLPLLLLLAALLARVPLGCIGADGAGTEPGPQDGPGGDSGPTPDDAGGKELPGGDRRESVPEARPDPALVEPGRPEPDLAVPDKPDPLPRNGIRVRVSFVIDGDTVYVQTRDGGWEFVVRLAGLNSPECFKRRKGRWHTCYMDDEHYGNQAAREVEGFVSGGYFTVRCNETDGACEKESFGRYLLALTSAADGKDLGERIVEAGAGWSYTKYAFDRRKAYCYAEARAIKARRGMWAQGRAFVKSKMSSISKAWYEKHDQRCTTAMGSSFTKAAGE